MFILNDHAGKILFAVLDAAPLAAPDDICVNEVSLVELADKHIYVFDKHDNVVLRIVCNDAADAAAFAARMKLI